MDDASVNQILSKILTRRYSILQASTTFGAMFHRVKTLHETTAAIIHITTCQSNHIGILFPLSQGDL